MHVLHYFCDSTNRLCFMSVWIIEFFCIQNLDHDRIFVDIKGFCKASSSEIIHFSVHVIEWKSRFKWKDKQTKNASQNIFMSKVMRKGIPNSLAELTKWWHFVDLVGQYIFLWYITYMIQNIQAWQCWNLVHNALLFVHCSKPSLFFRALSSDVGWTRLTTVL